MGRFLPPIAVVTAGREGYGFEPLTPNPAVPRSAMKAETKL